MQKFEFIVQKSEKLLRFLSKSLKSFSYSDLCIAVKNKDILVNRIRVKQDISLNVGDRVTVFLNQKKFKFKIAYQDENIVVFDKPKNIEVCDGDYNLQTEYENYFGEHIFAVHRLDAGTSGLVIFAKTKKVENFLIQQFKSHNVTKYYYAVVSGKPKQQEIFKDYLIKDAKKGIVKIVSKKEPNSFLIETSYSLVSQNAELSLLSVKIMAGKTHQIRAHLAYHKLPIVGDDKYGNKLINKKFKKTKQMLDAYKIVFDVDNTSEYAYLNNLDLCTACKFKKF